MGTLATTLAMVLSTDEGMDEGMEKTTTTATMRHAKEESWMRTYNSIFGITVAKEWRSI
jgi:hypothetical protein